MNPEPLLAFGEHLPILIIMLPLAGAVLNVVWPLRARAMTAITALLTLAASIALGAHVGGGSGISYTLGGWSAPLGITLSATAFAAVLVTLTGLVMTGCLLAARKTFADANFAAMWLFVWCALGVLFLSADLFNVYVGLELLGVAAVGLVIRANDLAANRAALGYMLAGLFGSLLFLLGVALVYGATGSLAVTAIGQIDVSATRYGALVLMTVGLLVKAAVFPLHGWLPGAHASAPAHASAVLSGVVVKAGIVLLWRLWMPSDTASAELDSTLLVLGCLGVGALAWGSFMALRAERLKLVVAYSTVAQMGYLVIAVPLLALAPADALAGGLMLLISHALAKAACFLAAGQVMDRLGHDRIDSLQGLLSSAPLVAFTLALGAVALVGLPPGAAFIGKWMLLEVSVTHGEWHWFAALMAGSALSAAVLSGPLPVSLCMLSQQMIPRRCKPLALQAGPVSMRWRLGLSCSRFALGQWPGKSSR